MNGHGECWLVANGDDGNKYWGDVRKYEATATTTSFKAKVEQPVGLPVPHRPDDEYSEPGDGISIAL